MAITRAQQAKQLLAQGGRTGFQGGGADMGKERGPETGREAGPVGGGKGIGGNGGNTNRERGIIGTIRTIPQAITDAQIGTLSDPREKQDFFKPPSKLSFLDFIPGIGTVRRIASVFGPFDNKKFFEDRVKPSLLDRGMKVPTYQQYIKQRMAGNIDAYGNLIDDDDDNNIILPVDTTFAQAPSTEEQETEVEKPFQLSRRFRAEGGIMNADIVGGEFDFESARQMYGLGKLVKKVTKTVKKIAKSDIGKAAIAAASLYYMPKFGIKAQGGLAPFLQSAKTGIGNFFLGMPGDTGGRVAGTGLFSKIPGGGVTAAIAGTAIAAGLLTPEEETEAEELSRGEGIDIEAARNAILAARREQYMMDVRARGFKADGGRIEYQEGSKEPVAKKTMPLLDLDGKEMDLREEGGFVPIGRMEKADDVPARLSKNEFVFTADAVRNAGDGNVDKGAEVMYNMMKNLEAGGEVSKESQGLEGARRMFQTSKRLEEVL